MSIVVKFWGVRGSIPAPGPETVRYGGNTACVELRTPEQVIIFDAGSGLRRLGAEMTRAAAGAPIAATILISHTHWDHIQGLPFFAPAYSARNDIAILSARHDWRKIRRGLIHQMEPIHFPVSLAEMPGLRRVGELGEPVTILGDAVIRHLSLNHPGGCAGFRVETQGLTVAYLPDHEPYRQLAGPSADLLQAELVEFVRGVDLLILDSQYDELEYGQHRGWGHGCLADTVALALAAEVRQVALFHHDPGHDDAKIDAMVARGRALIAAEGSSLSLLAAAERTCLSLTSHGAPSTATSPAQHAIAA